MALATTGFLPNLADETLVDQARDGIPSAREELFRRHFPVAQRVAYRLLGNEHDALDAVQDAFLKAVLHLVDFDGRSAFQTWLMRIVHNSALDIGRKRKRRNTLHLDETLVEPAGAVLLDDPAARLHNEELRRAINTALDQLSPPIRATFVLFEETGLSYQEISEVLNVPKGTVMSRLHYARQKLQSYLDGIEI
jgi:RNA polymerase sigma-70 factor (ECF subfamily)